MLPNNVNMKIHIEIGMENDIDVLLGASQMGFRM